MNSPDITFNKFFNGAEINFCNDIDGVLKVSVVNRKDFLHQSGHSPYQLKLKGQRYSEVQSKTSEKEFFHFSRTPNSAGKGLINR